MNYLNTITMKKIITLFILALCTAPINHINADNQEYQKWEHEDVVGIYKEISKYEAQKEGYDISYEDISEVRYFNKVRLDEGLYEVEVYEKVDSKFWSVHYTQYFLRFRYNPFLFKFDEGILDWNGYDGVFYKKP